MQRASVVQCITVWNDLRFLRAAIESLWGEADRIVIAEGALEGRSDKPHSTDGTLEYCRELAFREPRVKLITIDNYWASLEEQKEAVFGEVQVGEWALINDSDEVYKPEDLRRVRLLMSKYPEIQEWVPVFMHFRNGGMTMLKVGPLGGGLCHQRFFLKVDASMHFSCHHPTACIGKNHEDSAKSRRFWPVRCVVGDWTAYHYALTKPFGFRAMKYGYYRWKLDHMEQEQAMRAGIADAIKDHDKAQLMFTGTHPEAMYKTGALADWTRMRLEKHPMEKDTEFRFYPIKDPAMLMECNYEANYLALGEEIVNYGG